MDEDQITYILAKCKAYDHRFPNPNPAMVEAWAEHFSQYPHVTLHDALEAVKLYHRSEDADVPRPANISKIARQLHQDAIDRDPEAHAARLEARSDMKAGEDRLAITAGAVNPDPATAEHRRKVIEQFVAMKSAKAAVPPAE